MQEGFTFASNDSIKKLTYAKSYLAKALNEENALHTAIGYELMGIAFKSDIEQSFAFYDKGIEASKALNDVRYPAIFYTYKGAVSYLKGRYKEALENHVKAYDHAQRTGNRELIFVNKHNIGILKKRLELYDEALTIFKECYRYERKNPESDQEDFVRSHLALADVYTEMHQIDSSEKYNRLGAKIAREQEGNIIDFFDLNHAINLFYKQNYTEAIELFQQTLPKIRDYPDKLPIIDSYFHLGKTYDSLNKPEIAIQYYQKVDSIFTLYPNHISSNVLENYEALYTYYRAQNDTKKEAHYIEKALFASSQSKDEFRLLSSRITKNFDRKELLEKQKQLNEALDMKEEKYNIVLLVIGILTIVFLAIITAFYFKQRSLRKRFHEFVQQHEKTKVTTKTADAPTPETIGVPKEVVDQVLDALETFENHHAYTESDITLTGLAKQFKTNSAYLSKVINTCKHKKFAEYLNDLRVDYAIHKIQTDKHFSLYTIKAIALEVGFNNSQSFARAFRRRTKMQPSDFIQQAKNAKNR